MKQIVLDASNWKSLLDFSAAIKQAIGAPEWAGSSIDALVDVMIFDGVTDVEPPYVVLISGTGSLPDAIRDEILFLKDALVRAGPASYADENGAEVRIDIAP